MGNAIWLFLVTPVWYLSALATLLVPGDRIFGLVALVGLLGLFLGTVLGVKRRQAKLLWFLLSPLLSQVYVALAGLLRGALASDPATLAFWIFMALQLALLSFLLFRFRDARLPGAALSLFGISYALFAAFFAAMSFTDTWL